MADVYLQRNMAGRLYADGWTAHGLLKGRSTHVAGTLRSITVTLPDGYSPPLTSKEVGSM